MAEAFIKVSMTEAPQFRRLVEFVEAVEEHAASCGLRQLHSMVEQLRDDLAAMSIERGWSDNCFVCGKPMPDASEGKNVWGIPGRGSAHSECYEPSEDEL